MKYILSALFLLFFQQAFNQYSKRVIFFTDKNGTSYTLNNPTAYLSQRAVDRRSRYNISIDSSDLPVLEKYIDSIRLAGSVSILGKSRWLNAVIIQTTDAAALIKINSFPFVKKTDSVAMRAYAGATQQPLINKFNDVLQPFHSIATRTFKTQADTFSYGASSNQIKIHKGEFLHNIGARGEGMIMAFLDAGYNGFQTNRFFDSARARNQFLGTWDFVQNNPSVNEDDSHGLNCFSTVASYIPGTFVGACPEAKYFLLRTEDAPTEQLIEEYNWCLGSEYADSAGVDVISSSLGYTTYDNAAYNHTYADMNGNTTVITRMADLAAKKGMLVVSSAGNEGSSSWKYISAPADGDSVLSIGAVNNSGVIASFSSFGPTSDGQIKPDVVSVGAGTIVSNTSGNTTSGNGTSFSCPNLAGLATCLWQLFPEFNNWKIITTLRASADRFSAPHPQYGFGLPDMKKATGMLLSDVSTMNAALNNFTTTINWNSKDRKAMRYEIERKLPNETAYTVVKTVHTTGEVFSAKSYQSDDIISNSPAGTVSYRIRQVIDTNSSTFSAFYIDSATVTLSIATSVNNFAVSSKLIQLFPNPASASLTITFSDDAALKDGKLEIYNSYGQLMISQPFQKNAGSFSKQIPLSSLQSGTYILVVFSGDQRYAAKEFVKQ